MIRPDFNCKVLMNFYSLLSFFFIIITLSSCTTLKLKNDVLYPISKTFPVDYQKTWRATMLALEDYPIETEDNEKGYLKTESINYDTIWNLPFEDASSVKAAKYTLHIKLVKGKIKGRSVVKVRILKKILVQKGFIGEPERIPSDSLEEKSILYRILREIHIEQAIANHYQQSS